MDADEYVKKRLEIEILWYDGKSTQNKWCHTVTRGVEIVCSAVIPLLAGFAKESRPEVAIIMGVLGILVATAAGFSSLLKFQENWIKYRTTAESLKKEKYLFQTKVQPYDGNEPLTVLVQRVETLVSQENTNWAQYMMQPTKEEHHHALSKR
jgi:Protein of unknown function (DUF4231)